MFGACLNRKTLAQGAKTVLVAVLSLGVSGIGPAASHAFAAAGGSVASPGEQALAAVVEASQSQTVVPILNLQKALLDAQAAGGKNLGSLAGPAAAAHAGLLQLRDGLQSVAGQAAATERGSELFFSILVAYYGFVGLLDTAYNAASAAGASIGQVPGDLSLVVPAKAAETVVRFKSQQAAKAGLPVYDISLNVRDAGSGNKTLEMSAVEAARYRLGAFMAFPSAKTAKDELRFEALKLVFANQSVTNTDLYSDEKVPISLPASADPLLLATRNQADLLAREGAYRGYVTSTLLQSIAAGVGGAQAGFKDAAHQFYELVALGLASRIDLKRVSQFVPSALASRLAHATGAAKVEALREAADVIADKFLALESQQRVSALNAALKASPHYLTEMSRDELRGALADAEHVAVSNLALVPIEKAMLSVDSLTAREQLLIFAELQKLVQVSVDPSGISDDELAEFERSRNDVDVMASFRRYDLAQKIIAAVDWLDGAKALLDQLSESDTVPATLLPAHPDPGMTLLAFKPESDNIPTWTVELVQSIGSKAAGVTDPNALRALMGIVEATPAQMLDVARDAHDAGVDSVLGEIQTLYRARENVTEFAWSSMTSKIRTLGRRAQSQAARKILLDLLRINDLATKASATSLASKIRAAFDDIVKNRSLRELDALINTISAGKAVIDNSHDLMQALFSDPATRDQFLRGLLSNAATFRSYIGIHTQDIQNSLPLLFQPLKLSAKAAADTGNPNPILFSDIVSHLKTAINTAGADVSVGQNVIGAMSEGDVRRGATADAVSSPVSPYGLLVAALGGTRNDPSLENKVLDFFTSHVFSRKKTQVTGDDMWPGAFRRRDLLPAYFDQGTSAAERVRRVTVAALLTPSLRDAALNGQAEANILLDPNADSTKILAQSEAFKLLATETGNDAADGLTEFQKTQLTWKNRWDAVKRVTAKTQAASNIAFYETLFLDIPAGGQIVANLYMALSSATDFTSDIGLFIDYATTYADMRPFADSNALGKGLISYSELQGINSEVHQMALAIANESIMNIYFYVAIGTDLTRAVRDMAAQKRFGGATKNVDQGALSADVEGLSRVYQEIGLDLRTSPTDFKKVYDAKEKELAPKIASNAEAKAEWDRWVAAKKATDVFNAKYGTVLAQMAAPATN